MYHVKNLSRKLLCQKNHIYLNFTTSTIFLQLLQNNAVLTSRTKIVFHHVEIKEESVKAFVEPVDIVVEKDLKDVQRQLLTLHTIDITRVSPVKVKVSVSSQYLSTFASLLNKKNK